MSGTCSDVEDALQRHLRTFRYAEVWLDYVKDRTPGFAARLAKRYPNRLIMVFRRRNLAKPTMSASERRTIIRSLAGKKALVDIDITNQARDLEWITANQIPIKKIISYHNFAGTPSDAALKSLVSRIKGHKPDIIKIATLCSSKRDALRLLELLLDLRALKKRAIILGMGRDGVITRVFGSLWGNEITFAPLKSSARSAPGQIPLAKLDSILRALR
jgi:3-dehydroquinate dehydratase type I